MRKICAVFLVLVASAPLWAGLNLAVGPGGGLALPLGGNIQHFSPSWGAGLDVRVTGFQPILGLGLSAGYTGFTGPYNDSLRKDSTNISYHFVPVAVYLFTDFSKVFPDAPVLPYLRLGAGPCYWNTLKGDTTFTTLDTTRSSQWDYDFTVTVGAEKRLGTLPLAVYLDLTANYITSSHFEKYGALDKDESYAQVSIGMRYLFH
jgi:hypothetical protein